MGTGRADDVFIRLLRQAGASDGVSAAFRDMPVSRVLAAFACARCAPPDGHALCLADQTDHRARRWAAADKEANRKSTGGGGPPLLASAGYEDRTLLGACIRALVPANVVFTIVDAVMGAGRPGDGVDDPLRVCADRRMMDRHDRTPLRLCKPAERDRTRLRAWAWLDAVAAREAAPRWRADAHAFGPCWEAVARPCTSPSSALLLGVDASMEHGCCREVDLGAMGRTLRQMKKDAANPKGRVRRLTCPHDARIFAFIERPLWADDPTVCNVFIEDDVGFAIAAEWTHQLRPQ
ncbi:hypothetical protein [Pandoravirus japonicus]|uniref:Uncharacterized protein n=1 Tax=Pandoravirus japonicus TaxID=2823154 RepID=A0A811BNY3_9VIRU|nr:hypothetical protein [Pandoravirus japonicus]